MHKKYLDMIKWDMIDPLVKLMRATPCSINKGVLDKKGVATTCPERIFVYDSLLLAIGWHLMKMDLEALLEAIFVVMGEQGMSV